MATEDPQNESNSLKKEEILDSYAMRRAQVLELRTKNILFYSATLFSIISIGSVAGLIYSLISRTHLHISTDQYTVTGFLYIYSTEVILLACLIVSSFFAFLSFMAVGNVNRQIIPDKDRNLLTDLITKDESGIDQYIRLSSLSGTTGFFTKLGLTGMPLATIGLTLIFTLLSLFTNDKNFFDLAKLTLGAFLGSYVQKGGVEVLKSKKAANNDSSSIKL